MWRGDIRQNISVAAPFVWRCLSGSTIAPFPHPAHRTGQADFPHPALGQDFTLSRATPSAASEHLLELIGFPISRSFTTYCVCLELRSLPSPGVTRLPRYYEPLRHPRAPSLSLTGFRLVIADHALGLPVFRALSLCTCRRHYPGAASERIASLISSRRISLPRKGCRVDLRIVLFEDCSAFTRVAACTLALSPICDTLIEGFSHFVTSMTAPIASGWSGCRMGFAPTGKRRLCTAHVESRCGAVALGRTYLLPPLSSGGALVVPPWLRFHIPLIEPDRQISRIRLSDKTSRFRVQRHLQLLNIYWS